MTDEILKDTKMLLGMTDDTHNEILSFYINDITEAILSYCRLEFLPKQLYALTAQLAALMYNSDGDGIISVTEGERRIVFKDTAASVIADYYDRLKPFMNKAARLPSELIGTE